MSKAKNRPDIETLLAERARFETWLDQLAAKASTMPAHVVERVRTDYETRLGSVIDQLRSRAEGLQSEATALEERLSVLQGALTAKRDARAEDELRALVGEFDDTAWRAKSAEHDSGIDTGEAERAACETDHVRVLEMLAEAMRPSRAPAEAAPEPVADVPREADRLADAPAPPEPERETAPPTQGNGPPDPGARMSGSRRPSPFDEIGFLRTVVGRTTPFPGVTSPESAIREADAAHASERVSSASPAVSEVSAAPVQQAPAPAPRVSVPTFAPPPIPDAPAPAPPLRASNGFLTPSDASSHVPRDSGGERRPSGASADAARSLKCQECGWMNYPTEWYCEKCGGELAAF